MIPGLSLPFKFSSAGWSNGSEQRTLRFLTVPHTDREGKPLGGVCLEAVVFLEQ